MFFILVLVVNFKYNLFVLIHRKAGALWDPKENPSEPRTLDARDGPGYRRLQTQTQGTKNALSGRYREDVRRQVNETRGQPVVWCGGKGFRTHHTTMPIYDKKQITILCLPASCDVLRSKQWHLNFGYGLMRGNRAKANVTCWSRYWIAHFSQMIHESDSWKRHNTTYRLWDFGPHPLLSSFSLIGCLW